MRSRRKTWCSWLLTLLVCCLLALSAVLLLNAMICHATHASICERGTQATQHYDVILVLGCGIRADGTPSPMLEDRLLTAISLYEQAYAPVIFLSGDHRAYDYNEIKVMKNFCLRAGVPESAIMCDDYGLSTYDSMWRAKRVFGIDSAVVVTQRYHLYRALYDANKMGIEAIGVDAALRDYQKQTYRNVREILARCKDFFQIQMGTEPTYTVLT